MRFLRLLFCVMAASVWGCQVTIPEDRLGCANEEPRCPSGWTCEASSELCRPPGYDGGTGTDAANLDAVADGGPEDTSGDAPVCPGTTRFSLEVAGSGDETVNDIVRVDDGYIVVGGTFSGSLAVGCDTSEGGEGLQDAFVAKLSDEGVPLWVNRFGSSGEETTVAVDVDTAGRIIVGGEFTSELVFERETTPIRLTSRGADDGFLIALDPTDGSVEWATSFGGPDRDFILQLATVRLEPQVCVVGGFIESLSARRADGSEYTLDGDPASYDGYVVCFRTSDGAASWGSVQGGVSLQQTRGIAVRENQLYIASAEAGPDNSSDVVFRRFTCGSALYQCDTPVEIFRHSAPGPQSGLQIWPRDDDVLVLAHFSGALTLGDIDFDVMQQSLYVASIDNDGEVRWASELGAPALGPSFVQGRRMVEVDGEVHIVGQYAGTFAPPNAAMDLELSFPYDGGLRPPTDGFHAVLDGATGSWLRATALGTGGRGQGLAAGPSGVVFVGDAADSIFGNTNRGNTDGFVHVLP